jgi:hypothetical protein
VTVAAMKAALYGEIEHEREALADEAGIWDDEQRRGILLRRGRR